MHKPPEARLSPLEFALEQLDAEALAHVEHLDTKVSVALCPHCREELKPPPPPHELVRDEHGTGWGCSQCDWRAGGYPERLVREFWTDERAEHHRG